MREIKFRAWDEKNRMMDSDFYIHSSGSQYDLATSDNITPYIEIEKTELKIMQYVGLKDKNGVEICEGDIVKIQVNDRLDWNIIKGKVVFLESAWLVEDVGNFAIELWSEMNEAEIIGNIYENPELLEIKKD